MEKSDVVAAVGQTRLLGPARIEASLAANDRLKFMLTALQAAASTATADHARPDLQKEYTAARMDAPWLLQMVTTGSAVDKGLQSADLLRLGALLATDLAAMARPLEGSADAADTKLLSRADH